MTYVAFDGIGASVVRQDPHFVDGSENTFHSAHHGVLWRVASQV